MSIQLGDEVRDTITGFKGIAVARTNWIHGCARITIQPKVKKDGKMEEPQSFDEPAVEVLVSKNRKEEVNTGGPRMMIIKPNIHR